MNYCILDCCFLMVPTCSHLFIALHKVGCVINNKFTLCAEVSEMSSRLTSDTRIYADKAKDLNRQVIDICCAQFMACTLAC